MSNRRTFLIALLFGIFFLSQGCDLFEDESNSIIWYQENLNDFILYAYEPDGSSFAVIDLLTGEIYRNIDVFQGIQSVASNEDGTLIYISTYRRASGSGDSRPGEIYKLNTSTWEHEIIYEQAAHLLENRNGGILFITKETDPSTGNAISDRMFGEITPSTGEITEIDSIQVDWGAWYDDRRINIHPFKPLIYTLNGDKELYRFDYSTSDINYLFSELPFPPLASFSLSGGGDSLFIPGGPVLDLNHEKTVGTIPVWRLGTAVARKDNKEVYITDPGGYLREPYSQGKLFVYDPENDQMKNAIELESVTDLIYLTPKERYVVVNNWLSKFIVVDLKTRSIVIEHEYIENNVATQSIQGMYLAPKPVSLR